MEPSIQPSASSAPTQNCNLDVDLQCIEQSSGRDCRQTMGQFARGCRSPPQRLGFKYEARSCANSFNLQFLWNCEDVSEYYRTLSGTGVQDNHTAFIVASDRDDSSTIYFQGFVEPNDDFNVDFFLQENQTIHDLQFLNITVYNASDATSTFNDNAAESTASFMDTYARHDNILQTISFRAQCSFDLFVGDRYGAFRLEKFQNEEQGLVTCVTAARFAATLSLPDNDNNNDTSVTRLEEVGVVSNQPGLAAVSFTEQVQNRLVFANSRVELAPFSLVFDFCESSLYEFCFSIEGTMDGDSFCSTSHYIEMIVPEPDIPRPGSLLNPLEPTLSCG